MKSFFTSLATNALLAVLALAQAPHYTVVDLGTLPGGTSSMANYVSNSRLIGGNAADAAGTQQAILWAGPFRINLGTRGLNSGIFGINDSGQIAIQAEIPTRDPNQENFCGYGTGLECIAVLWQRGLAIPLPTLGGNNATIGNINAKGEIPGVAENNVLATDCPKGKLPNGNGPQVLNFEPVVWGPKPGTIRELKRLPGDTVGVALWINDNSQATGASGTCANTEPPPFTAGAHAVLWDADGTPHDLGNLGGNSGGTGLAINNKGQVVGASSKTNGSTLSNGTGAFLWTSAHGMQDLGTLPGDTASGALMINDPGDIVGISLDASGNPRAVLWHNGVMGDLNDLAPSSPLFLIFPSAINSRGEISGFGATEKGDLHAFLAVPDNRPPDRAAENAEARAPLTDDVRKLIRERLPVSPLGLRPKEPR
ncbi:MAG TPA: hypothetical protein VMS37_14415 [Verrucomicrobiae bacterium]|nr:hypothetical protein [Verrucomicrobiae bacterium]